MKLLMSQMLNSSSLCSRFNRVLFSEFKGLQALESEQEKDQVQVQELVSVMEFQGLLGLELESVMELESRESLGLDQESEMEFRELLDLDLGQVLALQVRQDLVSVSVRESAQMVSLAQELKVMVKVADQQDSAKELEQMEVSDSGMAQVLELAQELKESVQELLLIQ